MIFASPWMFLFLLLIPLVLFYHFFRQQRGALAFSSTVHPAAVKRSRRQQLFRLPLILRILVIVLLSVGLARPQEGREKVFDVSKGVAIEMVVDRSGSMGAEMEFDGDRLNRLEVVKRVFKEFVKGNDQVLEGRPNDLIGMITFARYAETVCPLTLAHGALDKFLDNVQLVKQRQEDGTAIGDALALAAARLKTAEENIARAGREKEKTYEIKSKIIVLLTDGENNAGKRLPHEAATLAKEWGIKIYTIGVGNSDGLMKIDTFFGPQMIRTGRGVDKKALAALAENTGGIFRLAEDGDGLRSIYEEINQLEKSEVESVRYMDYRELYPSFVALALAFLVLEIVLQTTIFRKIP